MSRNLKRSSWLAAALAVATPAMAQKRPLDRLTHIVVLYLENRSFDNIFGEFPGADGVANALAKNLATQRDRDGKPYERLPQPARGGPFNVSDNPREIRDIPLPDLPNAPFAIDAIAPTITTGVYTIDPVHRFHMHRAQINGGKNDRFVQWSNGGGLVMGYYSRAAMENSELWKLARENTLFDRFFMGAFGGSFLNHQYLICACAPVWKGAPDSQRSVLDDNGWPKALPDKPDWFQDNNVTTKRDGDFVVNTMNPAFISVGNRDVLPPQSQPTIGDRLSAKGVDWAWYAGGFALAAKKDRTERETNYLMGDLRFQAHHQPFAYFERFNPNTPEGRAARDKHLRDGDRLIGDIKTGALPPVAFYKPVGFLNQHPGYAALDKGDAEVAAIAKALAESPMKDSYALIITYDENGGFWDHVAPPLAPASNTRGDFLSDEGARADFLGPATRVPTLLVGPFAAKGKIDSTEYETGSILRLITERFDLEPLPSRRLRAINSLSRAIQ